MRSMLQSRCLQDALISSGCNAAEIASVAEENVRAFQRVYVSLEKGASFHRVMIFKLRSLTLGSVCWETSALAQSISCLCRFSRDVLASARDKWDKLD